MAEDKKNKISNEESIEVNESKVSEVQEKKSPIKFITRIVLLISIWRSKQSNESMSKSLAKRRNYKCFRQKH